MEIEVKSKEHLDQMLATIIRSLNEFAEAGGGVIELVPARKQRTQAQNNALHKYLDMLAKALNDAGWDMKKTLKESVDIPWTMLSAKEHIWRPVQKAMIGEESTASAETHEYSQVYNTINRHIGQKTGVYVPWPSNRG